jgi:hypothetical protein
MLFVCWLFSNILKNDEILRKAYFCEKNYKLHEIVKNDSNKDYGPFYTPLEKRK